MSFLIFSLTETKEKFLPALSSDTGKPCLLLSDNCKACLYQRITWRFRHITSLFNLKISDWLSLVPEPGNIHWDGSHPTLRLRHAQPDRIRRQPLPKNAFAEIPALFYLIISNSHASRHNPLLHTFTGNNVIHCRYIFARNGILPPLYPCIRIDG